MKKNIIYLFFHALAALFCLCSCGLEEPIDTPQNSDGYVEFVARPVGFNNQVVETKATAADNFESTLCNCFFLVFDEISGNRIGFHQLDVTSHSTPKFKLNAKGLDEVTACFIANVPVTFASNITTIEALNSAVLDDITYADGGVIGTPTIDLDSDSSTPAVSCIPMFGIMEDVKIESISTSIQIPLARLFAKVSVELTMTLNNTAQANSYYNVHSYHVHNLPTKVKLIASKHLNEENNQWVNDESEWVHDGDSFKDKSSKTGINHKVYNTQSLDITNAFDKIYSFELYVPEFFLDPLDASDANLGENYATEKYKPLMYDSTKHPIYITIDGIFTPSLSLVTQSKPMTYTVYLGEDDCCSFSMIRNTLYKNSLNIGGIKNHKDDPNNLDHRVEISPLNLVDMNGESSNCYLIQQKGTYYLPPYKGVFKSIEEAEMNRCSGTTVEVEKDNSSISITNARYDIKTKCIVFDVGDIVNGNAVIILKNGNATEWSWHLWLNSSFSIGGVGLLDVGYDKYPNGSEMMSRNLGSSVLDGEGLYYQYGSKKPYIGGTYIGGGVNGTESWYKTETFVKDDGTEGSRYIKTVNDPCPPNYRMPGPNEWDASKGTEATTDVLFSYLISPAVGFSYTGFRNASDGNKSSNTFAATDDVVDAGDFYFEEKDEDDSDDPDKTNTKSKEYRILTTTTKRYYNIQYNVPTTQKFGGFWTNTSMSYFKYYNFRVDWSKISYSNYNTYITFKSCDYREVQVQVKQYRTKNSFPTSIVKPWSDWTNDGQSTTIYDKTQTNSSARAAELNTTEYKFEFFTRNLDVATIGRQNTKIITSENINNGYQVRCIKE